MQPKEQTIKFGTDDFYLIWIWKMTISNFQIPFRFVSEFIWTESENFRLIWNWPEIWKSEFFQSEVVRSVSDSDYLKIFVNFHTKFSDKQIRSDKNWSESEIGRSENFRFRSDRNQKWSDLNLKISDRIFQIQIRSDLKKFQFDLKIFRFIWSVPITIYTDRLR